MIRNIFTAVFAIWLSACATSYQPHNSEGKSVDGYSEIQLDDGTFRVHFNANAFTSMPKATSYWHKRAAELCGSDEYGYDIRAGEKVSSDVSYTPVTGPMPHTYIYPRVFGIVDCAKTGHLNIYPATLAENEAISLRNEIIRKPETEKNTLALGVTCSSPYKLEINCSSLSGPTHILAFDGLRCGVAASKPGNALLIMPPNEYGVFGNINLNRNQYINACLIVMRNHVVKENFSLVKIIPMTSIVGTLAGYLVELDGDAYTHLVEIADRGLQDNQ